MNMNEVAKRYSLAKITVRKWCLENNIQRKLGKQGVMEYDMTEADCKRFEQRTDNRGWKKGRSRKKT